MIDVCLLGCGGMMPLPERKLSSLLVRFKGKNILIDCGEGTQVAIKLTGWGFKSIDTICFTHYHADHIAGLPGLLSTIGNSGRLAPLKLIGPPGLKEIVRGLTVIVPALPFDLFLVELSDSNKTSMKMEELLLSSIPAEHSLTCLAYNLEIKRVGKFDPEKANRLGIPKCYWKLLQNGESVEHDGKQFIPDMVLGKPRKGLKISYCTDTRPLETFPFFCMNSDLLVCEGMYGEDERQIDAFEKKHMTFSEAAALAKESHSSELWLTHYSPSVKDPEQFLDAAKAIFQNSVAGHDLLSKTFYFDQNT
ncbi:MAG: ribonuclease Z [Clostridia bacterium]|nr:ribonuclease Z [Clostridia bacterium]